MEKLYPAYEKNNIAICFASDNAFIPYMATMIYSVIANGRIENNYDMVILHSDISAQNQEILLKMVVSYSNVSLRFVDVGEYIKDHIFYVGGKENFTKESYYRLLIPELMATYDKALYLDGDMAALSDAAELYHTELGDALLASSRDLCGMVEYYNPLADLKQYRNEELKLKNPENYFIAGMLLINIPAFHRQYSTAYLLDFAVSRNWRQHDQDVLNVLCEGRTKLVSASWDVMVPEFRESLPKKYLAELEESIASPKILHFGGNMKPWLCMDAPFSEYFWKYAAQTPFIQEIIRRRIELDRGVYSVRNAMEREFREGKAGARYILKYIRAWLAYKFKGYETD